MTLADEEFAKELTFFFFCFLKDMYPLHPLGGLADWKERNCHDFSMIETKNPGRLLSLFQSPLERLPGRLVAG